MKYKKIFRLLFCLVHVSFSSLSLVACGDNNDPDDEDSTGKSIEAKSQDPVVDPGKFALVLKDVTKSNGERNFVLVTIWPGSNGMDLREFYVTASFSDGQGTIKGNSGEKQGSNICYNLELDRCSLADVFLQQVKCLGKDDMRFKQGKAVSFRIAPRPFASVKKGNEYTLDVKIERQGRNAHTETERIVLTAMQDGKDLPKQPEQKSEMPTSITPPQAPHTDLFNTSAKQDVESTPMARNVFTTPPQSSETSAIKMRQNNILFNDTHLKHDHARTEKVTTKRDILALSTQESTPKYTSPQQLAMSSLPIIPTSVSASANTQHNYAVDSRPSITNSLESLLTTQKTAERKSTKAAITAFSEDASSSTQGSGLRYITPYQSPVASQFSTPVQAVETTHAQYLNEALLYRTDKKVCSLKKVENEEDTTPQISMVSLAGTPGHVPDDMNEMHNDTTNRMSVSLNTNTSSQIPAEEEFTVILKDEKIKSNHTNNFITVTIQPHISGISLNDLLITASFSKDNQAHVIREGSIMGCSGKKGKSYVYQQTIKNQNCSIDKLFLENVNCLGANDTSFIQGKSVSFRIQVNPGTMISRNEKYRLNIKIRRQESTTPELKSIDMELNSPPKKKRSTKQHTRNIEL
mmetsp:Transcript_2778/g.6185  ORF Transcript_2778/g.6185 Transcript_2778/m.6185 type:complete len:635 (+) Transcript_2778:9524-11428(+)